MSVLIWEKCRLRTGVSWLWIEAWKRIVEQARLTEVVAPRDEE
jgi:hypothetical protein